MLKGGAAWDIVFHDQISLITLSLSFFSSLFLRYILLQSWFLAVAGFPELCTLYRFSYV